MNSIVRSRKIDKEHYHGKGNVERYCNLPLLEFDSKARRLVVGFFWQAISRRGFRMKIRKNEKVRLLCTSKAVTVFCVGMFMFLSSMFFINNVNAEVFKATAYCSCEKCCDKDPSDEWYGITASGKRTRWGTVAVDKRVIKLGSTLRIKEFPDTIFRAEDVGGAIKGNHIDVWFPSHREALKFGVQKIVVQRVRNG
jgi:3D (Asp-Asp-Asp) domain-containing protein